MKKISTIILDTLTIIFTTLYVLFNLLIFSVLMEDFAIDIDAVPGFVICFFGLILSILVFVFSIKELSEISTPYNDLYKKRSIVTILTAMLGFIGLCCNIESIEPESLISSNMVFCVLLIIISIVSLIFIPLFEKNDFERNNPKSNAKKVKSVSKDLTNKQGAGTTESHEDIIKYLKEYKDLLDQGIITKEEFEEAKNKFFGK